MEARFTTILPQEGAGGAGESLPEHSSGCPMDSGGGGKISPNRNDMVIHVESTPSTAKGNTINPFARSSRLARSPQSRERSNSISTMNDIKKITNTGIVNNKKKINFNDNATTLQPQPLSTPGEPLLRQQNQSLAQVNQNGANNEMNYYNAWIAEKTAREQLQDKVNQLQKQVEDLKKQILQEKESKDVRNKERENIPNQVIEYFTDEEELARETEWIRVKNNKKRKMNTTMSPPPKQTIPTKKDNENPVKKEKAPPPVVVENIKNYDEFYNLLKEGNLDLFQIKVLADETIKINVPNGDLYRRLIDTLNKTNLPYHSYENKQNRSIKVIADRLHYSCKTENIVQDLRQRGYKCLEATPKLKWRTKQPLNMFMLTFGNDEDINRIYAITDIMGIRVQIKPLRVSKLVPQCKRCQAYGHTQRYCGRNPRCVKCAGKHHTKDCNKPADTKPKCVHCGEQHPANYRGCTVAKEMQRLKNKNLKKPGGIIEKPDVRNNRTEPQQITTVKTHKNNNEKTTYSQKVANAAGISKIQSDSEQYASTDRTLQMILDKLSKQEHMFATFNERLTKLEYSSKGAIPKQKNGY